VSLATIQITGPISQHDWERYKAAIQQALQEFRQYNPKIIKIEYVKQETRGDFRMPGEPAEQTLRIEITAGLGR